LGRIGGAIMRPPHLRAAVRAGHAISRALTRPALRPDSRATWPLGAWLAFLPVLAVYAFTATRHLTLPGVYMDAVNPDYLVVRVLNPHPAPIVVWVLEGNYLVNRFPLLIALYHGSQTFWVGLPLYAIFGTSVEGIRLTHALFGLGVLAAGYFAMLRVGVRALVAALACAALAIDPAFTYAFRTQSYITLFSCTWLLLAIATLPWREAVLRRRRWPAASGLFYGWSIFGYFIYGFFFPVMAIAVIALSQRQRARPWRYAGRWLGGFALGILPSLVGYARLAKDRGGVVETVRFFAEQQAQLRAFESKLSLGDRVIHAWGMLQGVVSDAWHHSMMFAEWVDVPFTPVKLALLVGVPVGVLLVAEARRQGTLALRLLVALPLCFMAVALVFGNRLGLLPLLYVALARAAQQAVSLLRAPRAVFVGALCALVAVNVAGQRAEGRRLEETHGVGLLSDAINRLGEDLARTPHAPFVHFPDWGAALPVAMLTHGRVGMDAGEDFTAARRMLCAGRDVAVVLIASTTARRCWIS
jgi:hypothetical protein